jgi:hypothetical protein
MEPLKTQPTAPLVRSMGSNKNLPLIVGACVVVILGVAGAWLISSKVVNKGSSTNAAPGVKVTSTEAGVLDPKVNYDNATGDLKDGGIGNEGTHHLERDGGPTHFVYLTSSVVDLGSFVGKKVQVWGQTLASKKAGWLMDVAKIQVVQ